MSRLDPPPLIGALLRVPAQAIHRRLIDGLNEAGFDDLRLPHIAVFSYPGPEGRRPTELAESAGISKQAMNQLLRSLEDLGYVERSAEGDDRRARTVHFTERGHAAWKKELEILVAIESEWRATLGDRPFDQLKRLLTDAWVSDLVP
jgi:DNA-binding MarR family transcriptional regulator